ncbi:hypothetical protein MPNT_60125 [Candidatus Methylacidithermus pantelleriae]|uniref:Uncharacterized protein n=1 Tax=Candidatus Methylacidithermus pantelleriae TaxID=2744239 RepID=A0A8J2BR67_9BACT|nr:hypothetical protein MPNT_60125 [Candidatus Methylacidithermus pantelleriae]
MRIRGQLWGSLSSLDRRLFPGEDTTGWERTGPKGDPPALSDRERKVLLSEKKSPRQALDRLRVVSVRLQGKEKEMRAIDAFFNRVDRTLTFDRVCHNVTGSPYCLPSPGVTGKP